jgi:hypothetical protein
MAAMLSVLEREVHLEGVLLNGTSVFSSLATPNGA